MEYKLFQSEVKEADEKELTVVSWISTENVDRAGDIVRADGMKTEGLPVVLWAHGRDAAVGSEPIARPLWIKPAQHNGVKGIQAKTAFFDDEQGRRLFRKVKEGFLSGWSIGFLVDHADPLKAGGRDIKAWRLLEYSLVSVPCNQNATTLEQSESGLFFKIMPDDEACGCADPCKGDVKCAGHKDRRKLQFRFVDSRPPKADTAAVAAVAAQVIREAIQQQADKILGKVR